MRPYVLLAAGLVLLFGVPTVPDVAGWSWPWRVQVPAVATAAVYVYEKDKSPVPPGVTTGIDRLNRERKIVATLLEADTTDGTGDVPDQYRAALAAARRAGLPAMVALAGQTVLRTTRAPATEAAVLEAVP